MAPKTLAKLPPKKRKSVATRNKSSVLSVGYQSRESSDESSADAPDADAAMSGAVSSVSMQEMEKIWQSPSFATQTSIAVSRSEDSEQTDQISSAEASTLPHARGKSQCRSSGIRQRDRKDDLAYAPEPAAKPNDKRVCKNISRKRQKGPPPIDSALAAIHNQLVGLESRFQKDLHQLETTYATEHYAPLLKLRNKLLEAAKALSSMETRPEECRKHGTTPTQHRSAKKSVPPCAPKSNKRCVENEIHLPSCELFECCGKVFLLDELGKRKWGALKEMLRRITDAMFRGTHCAECLMQPHKFWLYVFQRADPMLSRMLSRGDLDVLAYLRDVRVNLFSTTWPDSPDFVSNIAVRKKNPPLLDCCKAPTVSARGSVSFPGPTTSPLSEETGGSKVMYPSGRAFHSNSDTSTSRTTSTEKCICAKTVTGFELEFEFYPNRFIRNRILRKRYLIDVQPQENDYLCVKKYRSNLNPRDADSKVDLFINDDDAEDELSSESDFEGPCCSRQKRQKIILSSDSAPEKKPQRCHRLLDYKGPRLVAVEGSTVKWKSPNITSGRRHRKDIRCKRRWLVTSDCSVKSSSTDISDESKHSFLDFFGWNWDICRNKIMANGAYKLVELTTSEIQTFVTRDYEIASYLRTVVIPRAFAIYRSGKPTSVKARVDIFESILDTASQEDSMNSFQNCERKQLSYCKNRAKAATPSTPPAPPPPPPPQKPPTDGSVLGQPPTADMNMLPQNFARNYDDVDDVIEIPTKKQQPGEAAGRSALKQPTPQEYENVAASRRKVSEIIKNVNTIIHQANTHKAFHQPLGSAEPPPGAPLTGPIDPQVIPFVPDAKSYEMRSNWSTASKKEKQADDEHNGSEVVSEISINRTAYHRGLPCASDGSVKIDDSDALSSSGASEIHGTVETPSTSESDVDPNDCPCDLHMLEDAGIGRRRNKRKSRVDHIRSKRKSGKQPLCSMGRDILTDKKLLQQYAKDCENGGTDASFKEVSSSDSEAPPDPDRKSCKQQ